MDHSFAIDNYTAERYVLGELDEAERDAYEEHFFSCPVCADEIKSASEFMETARQVIQSELKAQFYSHAARRSVWGSWLKNLRIMLQPFPATACLLLMAVSGLAIYQNGVTIPQLARKTQAPQPSTTIAAQLTMPRPFALSESRSGPAPTIYISKDKALPLQFEIFDRSFDSYLAVITTATGDEKTSLRISKKDAADSVVMTVRPGVLESGRYDVVIRGINSHGTENSVKGEVGHFSFELNVQD